MGLHPKGQIFIKKRERNEYAEIYFAALTVIYGVIVFIYNIKSKGNTQYNNTTIWQLLQ